MKRYEIRTFGVDELELVEVADPLPGPQQVLIRVRACSINFRDLMMVEGRYNPRMKLPRVPFSDGAGEVVAVGSDVTRFKTGDRVAGIFMQEWIDGELTLPVSRSALGGNIDGMLSELVLLDEQGVVAIPPHMTFEEASTLPCAAVTAWNALVDSGNLQAGQTVLLLGTGGVSIMALQIAKLSGARVIITSSSDEKLERARKLGADETINYRETADWEKKARQLTGETGVDHVVEVGGAGTINKSLTAARMSGRVSVIGALSGGSGEVAMTSILQKNLTVRGIFVGSRRMFESMNRAFTFSNLHPVVDRTFPFDEASAALREFKAGAHFGKVVIRL
jgi:NADPH:quinone reductase-like Zn-dependent oxidoreductase